MSISETLEPSRSSNHMSEPSLGQPNDLGTAQAHAKASHPVHPDRSNDYTPPRLPAATVPGIQQGDMTPKLGMTEMPVEPLSDSSLRDKSTVKSEPEMLTPQYGSDMPGVGSNQLYGMQPVSSTNMQHPQTSNSPHMSGNGVGMSTMSMPPPQHDSDTYVFRPPFVVDLDMVKRTMEGVNRILGVDLSEAEVSESALLDDPSRDQAQMNDEMKNSDVGSDQKDSMVVAKGEYSHMRLIGDACGHIVAAVGRAVLEAAKESFDEGVKQGTPGMRPKPPVRKKRGGILGFKELASRANLSPWHFHRVFRVTTGVTPKTYGEALWEYLMLESGFNLDNEELTIDRNMSGKSSSSISQAISPTSSSSPQSPNISGVQQYSPNPANRTSPISGAGMAGAASGPNSAGSMQLANAQAMNQNNVPGTGRVRKARSRSRPSRSRSRTRSQTQSQVLTTLSAIGDTPVTEAPRGRSFTRGVPTSVAGPAPQGVIPDAVTGNQGHPAPMPPPPQHLRTDSSTSAFDTDWFGPSDDLLGNTTRDMGVPQTGNQGMDVPDLTALSLQQLGLDQTVSTDVGEGPQSDMVNWHMPTTMNPMRSGVAPSSVPNMSVLNSAYGNPISRLERFKSPETIANGEHNRQMDAAFSMRNYQQPPQGIYDDSALSNGYPGGLNMNSFQNDGDASQAGGFHMQQMGMNQGPVGVRGTGMNSAGMNRYGDPSSLPSSGGLNQQIHGGMNGGSMTDSMHENLNNNFQDPLQENFHENFQQEMFQQQHQGDDLGGLGDLPTTYYLGSKGNSKFDDGSLKVEDDEFVSALIGDDPPMLAPWNEADENPANEYGF